MDIGDGALVAGDGCIEFRHIIMDDGGGVQCQVSPSRRSRPNSRKPFPVTSALSEVKMTIKGQCQPRTDAVLPAGPCLYYNTEKIKAEAGSG